MLKNKATQEQILKIMLLHGTPEQQLEAWVHIGYTKTEIIYMLMKEIEVLKTCRDHWETSYKELKKEMQRREDYIDGCLV
jgi:hypothetical protein